MTMKQRLDALEVQSHSIQCAIDSLNTILIDLQTQLRALQSGQVHYPLTQTYDKLYQPQYPHTHTSYPIY